jgi:hypothetical protein
MRRVCVRSDFSASIRFWVQRFKPLRHPARDDFTRILQTFSRALVRVSAGPMVPVPVGIALDHEPYASLTFELQRTAIARLDATNPRIESFIEGA